MGPVERRLRDLLGQGINRADLRGLFGRDWPTAQFHFDRLFKAGALEPAGGASWRLKSYRVDAAAAAAYRRQLEDAAARRRALEVEQEAARWREQSRRRHEQEQRALFDGLGSYTRAERIAIVEERIAALRESREVAHLHSEGA